MSSTLNTKPRIQSIDWLRGWVMLTMTLDHTRDYFHADAFIYSPTDLSQTSFWIFITRFVTHYCAPVFVLLAGTSAYLVGRRRTKHELSVWLLKRGIWLVIVEITLVKFGWAFKLDYSIVAVQVIWALGFGMITLSGFIHLPKYVGIAIVVLLIGGHNLLDGFDPSGSPLVKLIWNIVHVYSSNQIGNFTLRVAYPVVPWLALMLLGYYLGELYKKEYDANKRQKILLGSGVAAVILFMLLRFTNVYGDPAPWASQQNALFTFLSFINVSKYPPSLLYLLITIGPTLILLYLIERMNLTRIKPLVIIGRVPMFWYILHIYIIHLIALFAASLSGYSASDMILDHWVNNQPGLRGYGFSLGYVYLFWISVCLLLFPLAFRYNIYKSENKDKWWLSYL